MSLSYLFKQSVWGIGIFACAVLAIAANKTVIVGVESLEYCPLYSFKGDSKKWQPCDFSNKEMQQGFSYELLQKFATSAGYTFKYKVLPVKRLLHALLDKEVDIKYPDNAYWASDVKKKSGVKLIYSDGLVAFIDGLMVLNNNKDLPKDKLKIIGTIKGFTPWAYANLIKSGQLKVFDMKSFPTLIRSLLKHRVDGIYINTNVGKYNFKRVCQSDQKSCTNDVIQYRSDLPHSDGFYHISTISRNDVTKEFNIFLKKEASWINTLKKKYNLE